MPESIDDQTIIWKEKSERMPLKLLFLGMIAAGCVPLVEKSRKQEEEKRRKEKLQSEYPELVSKLTILLGAGMTLSSAWNKIATNYSNKRKNNTIPIHPLYEEMLITCHEIESGVGEARAYEALESDVDCIVTGNLQVCLSRIFEKERGDWCSY